MARLRLTTAPTLGITATLALLWLLAAAQAGPNGSAAAALDPGRAGSIGEWWGALQLALALAVAVAIPESRVLALTVAALMAGEVGEVHLHAAHWVAVATGSDHYLRELKGVTTIVLGLVALGPVVHSRHRSCCQWPIAALVVGGAASVLLDLAPVRGTAGPWWAAAEEWSELAVYSMVSASVLSTAGKSHIRTVDELRVGRIAGRVGLLALGRLRASIIRPI